MDLDDEPAAAWALRTLGADVTQRLLEPTVNGFYFQSMAANSAVLPAAVAAFGARPGRTLTIEGGLGRLPQALADHLDVRLGRPVRAVSRSGGQAVVTTDSGDIRADRVIIAVPGPAASAMLRGADQVERSLMSTPYSSGLLVGIPLPRPLHAGQLGHAYGVLVHPEEPTAVAALAVASRAHRRTTTGDLVTVMLTHRSATELAAADDHAVAATALGALEALDPQLRGALPSHPGRARVVRHPHAMPFCPRGHAATVGVYRTRRHTTHRDDPVVLAGDYLGFPWTDSAAATGVWAARAATAGVHTR
jgi:oxygen-dependent protoporphyrinogen oxidase